MSEEQMTPTDVLDSSRPLVVDAKMRLIYDLIGQIAPTPIPVLLTGETGSGKEVLAEWIHRHSGRDASDIVKVNCASLSESVVESELFGHEKGAFTGAFRAHAGFFETAHGGTLFLDEIGELPARTQAKLLRVLETGEFVRVGSNRVRTAEVRLISATHRDLVGMVERQEFRQDLYFRINGVTIDVPPLRERQCEILPLARLLLDRYALRMKREKVELAEAAAAALVAHPWTGNVRELRNVIERAAAMCTDNIIAVEALMLSKTAQHPSTLPPRAAEHGLVRPNTGIPRDRCDIRSERRAVERAQILSALTHTRGNQTEAAKILGVSRRTLSNKLNAYGIERPRKRLGGPSPSDPNIDRDDSI
jgi:DNA-binding NtrC family response regulator